MDRDPKGVQARSRRSPGRQRGASVIEFAFVFPLLLAMFYGIFVYGYIFLLFQSVNFAAEEGARAAVQVPPSGTDGQRLALAKLAAGVDSGAMAFLPSAQRPLVSVDGMTVPVGTESQFKVTVTMSTAGIFPRIPIPFVGEFPVLPDLLTGIATGLET